MDEKNREILFRGKSVDCAHENEWIYGYYNKHRGGLDDEYHDYILTEYLWHFRVDPDTVGQFTGLLDKNGNKIFEGDILLWDEEEWLGGYNELVRWSYELLSMRENDWGEHCTVVGNKWDNPELLNQ